MFKNHINKLEKKYMGLAFEKAFEHLGSTGENPSVGCVIVKNGSVISSGVTSINGRPHAETNALKVKKNFSGSTLFTTLEPCVHYGKTKPCVNEIIKNKIKKVYYPIVDTDKRTSNKAKNIFKKNKIKVKIGILENKAKLFYKSYFLSKNNNSLPLIDAKVAISKDFYSVNKKKKWITNYLSRNKVHLIRSKYDCILSTYKTINKDNARLNCRINGLEKYSPSRIIIDKKFKINTKLNIFNTADKIRTYLITSTNNKVKEKKLKLKKVKIIRLKDNNQLFDFKEILKLLKKKGFSRILCESGFFTTKKLIKEGFLHNLLVFQSPGYLGKNGLKSYKDLINQLKFKKSNFINLKGDCFYTLRFK